jgi:HicA toxin of bacterial toxin-antitoxin,
MIVLIPFPATERRCHVFLEASCISKKHDRTLAGIFTDPLPANVKWRDAEGLFAALGRELVERRGSRVTVFLNDAKATFHRPHLRPDADKGALRAVRRFLLQAGVRPEDGQKKSGAP